jgi:hypothetical protein
MRRCHKCGTEWVSDKERPGFKAFCEQCSAYLHACTNCRFYDPHAHNRCSIPTTEWVPDPEGSNYCDDFHFSTAQAKGGPEGGNQQAKDAFGTLFGEADEAESSVPTDFDKLFGD